MSYESPTIAELAAVSLNQPHQTVHAQTWPMRRTAGEIHPRPRSETQAPPSCLFQRPPKHSTHEPIPMDSQEVDWLNLRPTTKHQAFTGDITKPLGTLEGLDHFLARVAELPNLITQQERDAATSRVLVEQEKPDSLINQELQRLGITTTTSSSSDDDDIEAANYAARNLRVVPYSPDPEELVRLVRRIEWEKAQRKNGPVFAITLVEGEADAISAQVTQPWMARKMPIAQIRDLGRKLRAALGLTTFSELDNARLEAAYYRSFGPAHKQKFESLEQSMDELGAEDLETKKKQSQGEQELLLHGDMNGYVVSALPWGDQIHMKGDVPHTDTPLIGYHAEPIEDTTEPSAFALWGASEG